MDGDRLGIPSEPQPSRPKADYIDVSWGQAHRWIGGERSATNPTLYALHGTAYSGRSFFPLMSNMGGTRVAALDTPGYGGSTKPSERWSLPKYADAVVEAIDNAGDTRIDLLGYHTGALLAALIASARPDLVRRLILIGVPYFPDVEERDRWRRRLAKPMRLTEDLAQFEERWDFLVQGRASGASLPAAFGHFVDELRAWPFGFWCHEAVFDFDPVGLFSGVLQPTLIINSANTLAPASQQAASELANSRIVDLPGYSHGVLDVAASELAGHIESFTDAAVLMPTR